MNTTKIQVQTSYFVPVSVFSSLSDKAREVMDAFYNADNCPFTWGGNNRSLVDQKSFFRELDEVVHNADLFDENSRHEGLDEIEKSLEDIGYEVYIDLEN